MKRHINSAGTLLIVTVCLLAAVSCASLGWSTAAAPADARSAYAAGDMRYLALMGAGVVVPGVEPTTSLKWDDDYRVILQHSDTRSPPLSWNRAHAYAERYNQEMTRLRALPHDDAGSQPE